MNKHALVPACMTLALHSLLLFLDFLAANEQTSAEIMLFANLAQLVKYLQSQFSGWGDDKGTKTIHWTPLEPVQLL